VRKAEFAIIKRFYNPKILMEPRSPNIRGIELLGSSIHKYLANNLRLDMERQTDNTGVTETVQITKQ